jgi:hydrogenase nickel incorporation protein HypA/HybF
MHELSLAENILQLIEDAAQQQHFTQVEVVWLEIGQLACVEQESLRFFFNSVKKDTIAQEARLDIIEITGQGTCNQCHQPTTVSSYCMPCPRCGSYAITITQGDEMRIHSLEVK